jgi:hypothetical protein
VGVATNAAGVLNTVAIGAHGSNNEYLLRNSTGTDERHTQSAYLVGNGTTILNPADGTVIPNKVVVYTNPNGALLVCYNCHAFSKYGSVFSATGLNTPALSVGQPHAGEYATGSRCNAQGNTIPFNGYTTGKLTDGTQFGSRFLGPISKYSAAAPYVGETNPDFGNVFGMQCANCHNSGLGNAYGGIHGSANNTNRTDQVVDPSVTGGAYIDGMGNTTKVERFLPGLGNAAHVPGTLGGFSNGRVVPTTESGFTYTYTTGGVSNDTNWEQKQWKQNASTVINYATGAITGAVAGGQEAVGAGCYTLGGATAAASKLEGPSVTGAGGPATEGLDTWGGCEDHGAVQGKGDHGFLKKIVRPVTY